MSVFHSQFDRAQPYTEAYAGDAREPAWRSPTVIAAVVGGGAAVAAAAIPVVAGDDQPATGEKAAASGGDPADGGPEATVGADSAAAGEPPAGAGGGWGEGWDAGWDLPAGGTGGAPALDDGGASWMDRGEYTDAGVGGDGDFFYFIDGDSSAVVE